MALIALRPDAWPRQRLALHDTVTSRQIEALALAQHPPFTLMHKAGKAVFQLSAALYPCAQGIWVACGPGHNGGDGLVAAAYWQERLKTQGGHVVVTGLGDPLRCSPDTQKALAMAHAAGVSIQQHPPAHFDLAIDALWGLGLQRPPEGLGAQWLNQLQTCAAPVLCVDLPSGLEADTGRWLAHAPVQPVGPRHTLSLLTLKPGLWTGQGRACSGEIWFDDLDVAPGHDPSIEASGWLQGAWDEGNRRNQQHLTHKGSFGDVWVLGGQRPTHSSAGMVGAAWLAARAALRTGAGRVYLHTLGAGAREQEAATADCIDPLYPEIMQRASAGIGQDPLIDTATVVCGCGGGQQVGAWLPALIARAPQLVLDADGLNTLAADPFTIRTLGRRQHRDHITVFTPHPLEAARLLATQVDTIQGHRLQAAQTLAEQLGGVVVLKGSGTVVAAPGQRPIINPTGNANLSTAGSGDVLAGMLGAALAAHKPRTLAAAQAICAQTVFAHGLKANRWTGSRPMVASDLL